MEFEDFIANINPDFSYNVGKLGEMIKPSKKQDSEQPSNEPQ